MVPDARCPMPDAAAAAAAEEIGNRNRLVNLAGTQVIPLPSLSTLYLLSTRSCSLHPLSSHK